MNDQNNERRKFIKKAAYVAPAVITLSAAPSIAQSGSGNNGSIGSVHGNRPSGAGAGRRHGDHGGRR